jgi:preprotein translocase subunit SecA
MGPVYDALGLSVGAIRQGMRPPERRAEYARDITYTSNKEIAFDYLRDRLALGRVRTRVRLALEQLAHDRSRAERLVLRGLVFAIVDEADSVLIDEARTPLIISAGGEIEELEEQLYENAIALARELEPETDFTLDVRSRRARLTEAGEARLEALADGIGGMLRGPRRREELVTQALGALHGYQRDVHYLVTEGKVRIVDEFTGRVMPDRTWQRGLHQMIEAKEGCEITAHTEPLARISYQRFFRRYLRLAGMTGTASEVAGELWAVYRLPVARIPTNRPVQRKDWGSRVFATAAAKWTAVVARIRELHEAGRPVLVGTRSVAASEHLAALLSEAGLEHRVLNARQDQEEAEIVAQAGLAGRITVATNMAGRGTDIRLEPSVQAAGGLHVIATERHESHRIDRQLFGRCGRQGDPGSFEAIVSLEDELFQAQARWLAPLAGAQYEGVDENVASTSRRRGAAMRAAQWRAERLHAKVRRSLLKIDERVDNMLAFSGKGE